MFSAGADVAVANEIDGQSLLAGEVKDALYVVGLRK